MRYTHSTNTKSEAREKNVTREIIEANEKHGKKSNYPSDGAMTSSNRLHLFNKIKTNVLIE